MSILHLKKFSTLIVFVLMYCFTASVFAQINDTITQFDTLAFQKSLNKKTFDNNLDDFYAYKYSDSLKAAIIITHLENNFLTSTDENEIAESYLTISAWEDRNGNYEAAMANVDSGIQIAERLANKKLLYEGYTKKGNYLYEKGENILALGNYIKAMEVCKETGNLKRQLIASNNVSLIKIQVGDNLGAIELYLENFATIENSKDESLEPTKLEMYVAITKAYINLDQYDKAALYCDKGLAMSLAMNSLHSQAQLYTFSGEISSNLGNIEKAHKSFEKAYELLEKAGGDPILDVFLKLYVGKTYFFEKKYALAIAELLKGEALIEKLEVDFLSIQELYIYLAKSYLAAENIQESTSYFNKATDIYTKNDKKRAIIHSKITKNTLDTLEAEINMIQTKSEKSKYLYFTGIAVLLIIIVGLLIFYKKQQQRNKKRFAQLMVQLEEKRHKGKIHQEAKSIPEEIEVKELQKNGPQEPTEIDATIAEILESLKDFEEKELFLSKESTLVEVAKKIQTNTTYLSKVINTYKEKTFTSYITDLRVDYAIDRLSHDRKFRSFTIGAIAQEIGFKRSESFSKAFKVKTGLYPSYFIKELEKQIDSESNLS